MAKAIRIPHDILRVREVVRVRERILEHVQESHTLLNEIYAQVFSDMDAASLACKDLLKRGDKLAREIKKLQDL